MELTKAKIETYKPKDIQYIKKYFSNPEIGSEISCYRLSFKQVLKIFNPQTVDFSTKLLISDALYGTDTYIFVDRIIKYCNEIYAYTMKYVEGPNLDKYEAISIFYKLSYNMLLEFITTLVNDSKTEANYGIEAFDCYKTNIILSPTGFKQIDCVDFIQKDIDPSIIEKTNIRLMCQTIYDQLIAPYLSTFISNNNLNPNDFIHYPYEFIQELQRISQNYSDTEIITLEDTKKLSRKK